MGPGRSASTPTAPVLQFQMFLAPVVRLLTRLVCYGNMTSLASMGLSAIVGWTTQRTRNVSGIIACDVPRHGPGGEQF